MPFPPSQFLGAVLAIFVEVGALRRLTTIVAAASLFNDGVALVLVATILGGVVLRHIGNALLKTTITLIIAYGGYLLADAFHSSGPLETVMAALLLSANTQHTTSSTTRLQAGASWGF